MKMQNAKCKMQKFLVVCLLATCYLLLPVITLAYYAPKPVHSLLQTRVDKTRTPAVAITKGEVSNKPADFWWIWWTGIGNFADYTISNTLQGGYYGNSHACGDYFDATTEQWVCAYQGGLAYKGLTGEYPAGSKQHYVWAAGVWIGALYPVSFDSITGEPTAWQRRVSKGAYYSDMGGMAIPELEDAGEVGDISYTGLALSTQIIPWNHNHEHEGKFIFKQSNRSKEDYQALWHFADTLINSRREDDSTHVHPDSGDILSGEDTYAVAGDWIPEQDATGIWIRDEGLYDVHPLGIRVEQRTYSWNYDYNNAYIYLNWKIRNMNSFPLDSIYVGYFMDNDIGEGMGTTGQGAEDDLIGFDTSTVEVLPGVFRDLDLGYTYDSDGYEENWTTDAGLVGCVLCETPDDKGFTGFQYWTRVGEFGRLIDENGQDSLKYEALACHEPRFIVAGTPSDMRQLSCSGPYIRLLPYEEIDFTVAIVVGYTLDELKSRAITALKQFELGYLGYEPPPSPELSVIPGDNKVYISWDGTVSESYVDRMAKQPTFEGYRVYRSKTGLSGEWDTLAISDLKSSTYEKVLVRYTKTNCASKAEISFGGLDTTHSGIETKTYKIVFNSEHDFLVWDSTDNKKVFYNSSARTSGDGYCIMDNMYGTAYSTDPGYISDAFIYINGFYVKIKNGEVMPNQRRANRSPCAEDEFMVWAYGIKDIGREVGIKHHYIDEDVTNGMKYYYAVTSFSRPLPELEVGSLESGKTGTKYWAIPLKPPADYKGTSYEIKKLGFGDIRFDVEVANPKNITGDSYEVSFFTTDTLDTLTPEYWKLVNKNTGDVLIDSCTCFDLESPGLVDTGLSVKLATVKGGVFDTETVIDSMTCGWKVGKCNWELFNEDDAPNTGHRQRGNYYYSYELMISDTGSNTGSTDVRGKHAPFTLWNTSLDTAGVFVYTGAPDSLWNKNQILIYGSLEDYQTAVGYWLAKLKVNIVDTSSHIPPEVGDLFSLKILNGATVRDTFEISTTKFNTPRKYTLDSLRVVPNPYYLRAVWDQSEFRQKVWFQGLPSKCTIRIFNIAGLLIKTIEHDEPKISDMKDRTEMSGPGAHAWDLCSEEKKGKTGLKVASGLYIYQVITSDGQQKVGKFAIIR